MAWRKSLTPAKLVDFLEFALDDTNPSKAGLVALAGGVGTPIAPPPRPPRRARMQKTRRRRPPRPPRRSAPCPKPRRTRICCV
jgi:hypothetical protein